MLEVNTNTFVVKSRIISMKVAAKDSKYWVVFNCGRQQGEVQSIFSSPFTDEAAAKAFLTACAQSL
jgi:hypothetical protein